MDDVQPEVKPEAEAAPVAEVTVAAEASAASAPAETPKPEGRPQGAKPQGQPRREDRPPRPDNRGGESRGAEKREGRPGGENRGGERGGERRGPERGGDRGGDRGPDRGGDRGRPGAFRPFDAAPDIELEKLISDSLYLDNQAHAVVVRMRDMDSGTKSQLRRLYNAVRRAVRAPESERQHQFVMLRARLAYTIARHSLRSLDALERLLLQVTRRNDARGYERFKDLFEAIVAYNE